VAPGPGRSGAWMRLGAAWLGRAWKGRPSGGAKGRGWVQPRAVGCCRLCRATKPAFDKLGKLRGNFLLLFLGRGAGVYSAAPVPLGAGGIKGGIQAKGLGGGEAVGKLPGGEARGEGRGGLGNWVIMG
jgi:hypothetical protein